MEKRIYSALAELAEPHTVADSFGLVSGLDIQEIPVVDILSMVPDVTGDSHSSIQEYGNEVYEKSVEAKCTEHEPNNSRKCSADLDHAENLEISTTVNEHASEPIVPSSPDTSVSGTDSDYSPSEQSNKLRKCKKTRAKLKEPAGAKSKCSQQNTASVYSSLDIRNHERRLKRLKALEKQSFDDSEEESEPEIDRDLDINLRIFESSCAFLENVIVGEIQCDVRDSETDKKLSETAKKNSNVFKVLVNTGNSAKLVEQEVRCSSISKETMKTSESNACSKNARCAISESEEELERELEAVLSDEFGDLNDFSDEDDSDLDVLVSKPMFRKRPSVVQRTKLAVRDESSNKKLTMYDLICDSITTRSDDINKKPNDKKSTKSDLNTETEEEILETIESAEPDECEKANSQAAISAVPQLKVTADGEVVLDMESLIVEQTGLSEAREAMANSEFIEEFGSTNKYYTKKRTTKQWSPQGVRDAQVNALREKTKVKTAKEPRRKMTHLPKPPNKPKAKGVRNKRKSFFEKSIQCFQNAEI